ncbi:MAG: ribosome biogenesis/translation initiation ATPase RLI [Methanomicrobia archaeon]|nr:ribosome biogenesis/translation initiation ATPase RLI [Methanomicrobia archaeon]
MRIAVIEYDKCKPKKCGYMCIKYCPRVRMGDETITVNKETKKPVISEELCVGCGICVHKCPFGAIHIVNLPEELETPVHQYGENSFRLYRLPVPKENSVLGIIGSNGTGKTTAIKILSGEIVPNFGDLNSERFDKGKMLEYFRGSELQSYFEKLESGIKAIMKPQYVDKIPKVLSGTVEEIIEKIDERGVSEKLIKTLDMENSMEKDIKNLSGGELQRVAIIAAMSREGDVYYFDEPSSYLDIYQRLNVARSIRELSKEKTVIVVEHDLAVLDYLSDYIHIIYGVPGVYGIVSSPMGVRVGINTYLEGYLKDENVRFRDQRIEFDVLSDRHKKLGNPILEYPDLIKSFEGFELKVEGGVLHEKEIIGIIGPNATGKSTFVKMLAGVESPDNMEIKTDLEIAYKPQYIKRDFDGTVRELLRSVGGDESGYYRSEIIKPLQLENILDSNVGEISGGELQRVAIAVCLTQDADIYLLDEPSAYLDIEQRLNMTKLVRKKIENSEKCALIVEHDIVSVDYISDRTIVFSGDPGVNGHATQPLEMREGMNMFLKDVGVTFRRDHETKRPRANKLDSQLDRKQKSIGEYYYMKE